MEGGIICNGFTFYNDFDSANLAKVVYVPANESVITVASNSSKQSPEIPDAEFNLWTRPDCCGTEFENGNRTWFYFGVKAHSSNLLVRLNIVDLNRQGKMYSQGMAPVYRILPGKPQWERIRDKPIYNVITTINDHQSKTNQDKTFQTIDDIFTLSFKYKTPDNPQSITYFAFTYPYSYTDLLKQLNNIDLKFSNYEATYEDDIYYTKETLCRSLGGRDVHLLTISSYHGITPELEIRLRNLFPDKNTKRPFKFIGKKIIFISARVHPGETPSSFVFNGFLNLLLTRDDPLAIMLRRLYVFKLIPFLNPDGVALGHYRTDTRGVNLNRVYLNPIFNQHPTVYAARALLRYYHYGFEKDEEKIETVQGDNTISVKVSNMSLEENRNFWCTKCKNLICRKCKNNGNDENCNESGLFLYVDMHGHASKKGIFMYGNHFDDTESNVECMVLPKLMSLNNHNFHFTACNFTERNMYLKDRRDGMSREGSGRVAVLKMTGLIKSYTLECNYNTGRIVNVLPPTVKETNNKVHVILVPPKFTPQVYEEVGRSLGASILDLTGQNPHTRIPNSEFHSIAGLKDWLRLNCAKEVDDVARPLSKIKSHSGLHTQGKLIKTRPVSSVSKKRPSTVPIERKENVVVSGANERSAFRLTKTKKKEFTGKLRRATSEKKIVRSKVKKGKDVVSEQERLKLREIVLMKTNDKEEIWKASSSKKCVDVEAGPSTTYLANFAKNSSFNKCKFKKHTLRRLAKTTAEGVKGEKGKKRKKLKTK